MALPKDVQALLDALEPDVRRAFLDAIANITSRAQMDMIAGHIQAGNIEAAILALRIDPAFFRPLDKALTDAFYRGGVAALAGLPKLPDPFYLAALQFLVSTEGIREPSSGDEITSDD